MYGYLLFDIDDTLTDFRKSFLNSMEEVLRFIGVDPTEENQLIALQINEDAWFASECDDIRRPEIRREYHPRYEQYIRNGMRNMLGEWGKTADLGEMCRIFEKSLGQRAELSPHAHDVLMRLKKDCILCTATNGLIRLQREKAEHYADCIEERHMYISEALGWIKPEREYFEAILRDLGARPEEVLMIGDNLNNDIDGALGAGIDAVWFNPRKRDPEGHKMTYMIESFEELPEIVYRERNE